jgi:hypothetical protein
MPPSGGSTDLYGWLSNERLTLTEYVLLQFQEAAWLAWLTFAYIFPRDYYSMQSARE